MVETLISRSSERSWPSSQPSEEVANLNIETNQTALAFRNSLSVGAIKEWTIAVQVLDPYNSDLIRRISDFRSKFAKHGYNFSGKLFWASQGLSQKSADSLLRIQESVEEYVPRFRAKLVDTVARVYAQLGSDGSAMYSNSVIIKQTGDYFVLPGASDLNADSDPMDLTLASVLQIQAGEVVRNRLPVAIASALCCFS